MLKNVFEFHFEHIRVMANYLYIEFLCENMHFMVLIHNKRATLTAIWGKINFHSPSRRHHLRLHFFSICKTIEDSEFIIMLPEKRTEKYFSSCEWIWRNLQSDKVFRTKLRKSQLQLSVRISSSLLTFYAMNFIEIALVDFRTDIWKMVFI